MGLPAFAMFVEYVCDTCKIQELHTEIIPKHKCPECGFYFTANELEEDDSE